MARFISINQLAEILGVSNASIYSNVARKNYSAIPKPIKIGRKLAWVDEEVELWINNKIRGDCLSSEIKNQDAVIIKKIGRPSKAESIRRKRAR